MRVRWLSSLMLSNLHGVHANPTPQRHNKNPGSISYGAGDPGAFMALGLKEPTSIRLAQLRIEHAQFFALDVSSDAATHSPHWPTLLANSMVALSSFEALSQLPATDYRLPMEADAPDFAWADVQAGAVAVKHAGTRLFASLQWRHGYLQEHAPRVPSNVALNNVSRIHYTVLSGNGNGTEGSRDHVVNVEMQQMSGQNGGWQRLYSVALGDFVIAMNGMGDTALSWSLPPTWNGSDVVELISGKRHCGVGTTMVVEASSAMVLRKISCE
jgi:hypothetical protein